MKFCQHHWDSLKAAISARGLDKFIAQDGIEAIKRTVGQHSTESANFEPLMMAHNLILSQAIERAGLAVIAVGEDDKDQCPQCFMIENCQCDRPRDECKANYEDWTNKASDVVYEEAKRLGLVVLA